jgi:hypothetical protein
MYRRPWSSAQIVIGPDRRREPLGAARHQLQIVTYTGGRKRDGGTPAPGEHMSCMANGVDRKFTNEVDVVVRRSVRSVVAYQVP